MTEQQTPPRANVRASYYYVVRAAARCGHCGQTTLVAAIGVPSPHETLDDDEGDDAWQTARCNALVFYVQELMPSVEARLRQLTPQYQV
jgi:hypothetical protein